MGSTGFLWSFSHWLVVVTFSLCLYVASPLCLHSNLFIKHQSGWIRGFPHSSVGKESTCNAGDPGLIPGSGRSPGEGNGNPLQYCCLENPMDRGAWHATVHVAARVGHDLATSPPPPPYWIRAHTNDVILT